MEVLFVIWAGIIPLVPLIGVQLFKQRCDKRKAAVCRLLFFRTSDSFAYIHSCVFRYYRLTAF